MRILLWHGWLLEGSGSNVYAARTAEAYRRAGHRVLLLCQESRFERFSFVDAWGTVDGHGVSLDGERDAPAAEAGHVTVARPAIGRLLPVFVYDDYEGFQVKRFVDLSADELHRYLDANEAALEGAASSFEPDVTIVGHAVCGPAAARRALGAGAYVAKLHGSDLEYAVGEQERYRDLAREGLEGARAVVGTSSDVLERAAAFVPSIRGSVLRVPPGVDVRSFRPADRGSSLRKAAAALRVDPDTERGRPGEVDALVASALDRRDAAEVRSLASRYDQTVPDPAAAERLLALADSEGPLVGYIGKLIPAKGVDLLLAAATRLRTSARLLVIGFGLGREWLTALSIALARGDEDACAWVEREGGSLVPLDATAGVLAPDRERGPRVTFTGRLDHRYAPLALAALDVLVVPSILDEAFGMVAAEGAAAGALPLVAGHSGLAEVGATLEEAVERPGLFAFEPGPGAPARIAGGVDRLLSIPRDERRELGASLSRFVAREWTWERTADRLLDAYLRPRSAGG